MYQEHAKLQSQIPIFLTALDLSLTSAAGSANVRVATAKKLVSLIGKNLNTLEDAVPADMFNSIVDLAATMQEFVTAHKKGGKPSCRATRLATTPYLRFMRLHGKEINDALDDPTFWQQWEAITGRVAVVCR